MDLSCPLAGGGVGDRVWILAVLADGSRPHAGGGIKEFWSHGRFLLREPLLINQHLPGGSMRWVQSSAREPTAPVQRVPIVSWLSLGAAGGPFDGWGSISSSSRASTLE